MGHFGKGGKEIGSGVRGSTPLVVHGGGGVVAGEVRSMLFRLKLGHRIMILVGFSRVKKDESLKYWLIEMRWGLESARSRDLCYDARKEKYDGAGQINCLSRSVASSQHLQP